MNTRLEDRLERVTITPQILFHTLCELEARGIDLGKDPAWRDARQVITGAERQRLTFRQSQSLILRALALSGDPDLGLFVGARQSFASFGLLAAGMLASGTLRDALELGCRYHRVTGSMLEVDIETIDENHDALSIRSRFAGSPIRRFLMQEALVLILKSTQFLSPKVNAIVELQTPFVPNDRRWFEIMCPCAVTYGGHSQRVIYQTDRLTARMDTADPFALRETQHLLDVLLQQELAEVDILQSVEARILRNFPRVESLTEISAALGTSERSLRRQLAASGTTYRGLLKRLRQDRARQRLEEGTFSRDQIAADLGFSDARSLRRLLNG